MLSLAHDFPRALPGWLTDESLYSLVSGYHVLSGGRIPSSTCLPLFGYRRQGRQYDLPTRLAEFAARTED